MDKKLIPGNRQLVAKVPSANSEVQTNSIRERIASNATTLRDAGLGFYLYFGIAPQPLVNLLRRDGIGVRIRHRQRQGIAVVCEVALPVARPSLLLGIRRANDGGAPGSIRAAVGVLGRGRRGLAPAGGRGGRGAHRDVGGSSAPEEEGRWEPGSAGEEEPARVCERQHPSARVSREHLRAALRRSADEVGTYCKREEEEEDRNVD
ncbi:hypothetical protein ACLOJK_016521 [Asimina triloba]